MSDDPFDDDSSEPSRRVVIVGTLVAGALAVLGVWWYAKSPDVESYNLGSLLVVPLLVIVLYWLHKHLPAWVEWSLALAVALVGPVGYLVIGGSQWWNWGQYTVFPLFFLIIARAESRGSSSESWYGGPFDGPWGPP